MRRGIPVRKRLALEAFRLRRRLEARRHELAYLFWECTLRCNLSCLHCGSDCRGSAAAPDMPLADFLRVLDEVAQRHDPTKVMIALTGGEPLLRKDLEECGREFSARGYPWGLVTNGWAPMAERLNALTDAGLKSATVSLDGLEESHDWLRGRLGSYRRALDAVAACAARKGLVFDVVTCVNQRNYGELDDVKRLLVTLGVKRWRLFTIFPKGRARENELLDVTDSQFRGLLDFIKATRRERRIRAEFSCEGFLGPYEGDVRDTYFWCRAGVNIGSVLADGSISACPSLRADYIQGNIYRDRFLDVWENRFRVMRDRRWTKTGECADCEVYRWCEGNGLHLRDEETGALLRCHHAMLDGSGRPATSSA